MTLAPIPTPRSEVAAAAVDRFIYVVGGITADGEPSAAVERYDPSTNVWESIADLPIAVHHAMAAARGEDVFVMGGYTDADGRTATDRVFRLRDDIWTEVPPMRRARAAGAAVTIGTRIVVMGGRDHGPLIATSEVFRGGRWRDAAPIPTPRDHLAAATDGVYAYAVDGRRLTIASSVAVLERYDPRRDRWKRLRAPRLARSGIGAVVTQGKLIVLGGEGPGAGTDGTFAQVESYQIVTDTWEREPFPMPVPRHGLAAVAVGPTIYTAAGGPEQGGSVSDVVEALRFFGAAAMR